MKITSISFFLVLFSAYFVHASSKPITNKQDKEKLLSQTNFTPKNQDQNGKNNNPRPKIIAANSCTCSCIIA